MNVTVQVGKAWINGYFYWIDSNLTLTLPNAHGSLNRIDRIVLRWSLTNRNIRAFVKSSTPSANPVAPTLQRDADAFEICLADVYVTRGVTSILQSNITDRRLNKDLCGIVHGVVDQLDTTTLGLQLQGFIDSYIAKCNLDYADWQTELNRLESNILALFNEFKTDQEQKLNDMEDAFNFYISQLGQHMADFDVTWQQWLIDKDQQLQQYPAGEWMAKVENLIAEQATEKVITFEYPSFVYPKAYLWNIEHGVISPLETWGYSDGTLKTVPHKIVLEPENKLSVFTTPEYTASDWQIEEYKPEFYLLSSASINKALFLHLKE